MLSIFFIPMAYFTLQIQMFLPFQSLQRLVHIKLCLRSVKNSFIFNVPVSYFSGPLVFMQKITRRHIVDLKRSMACGHHQVLIISLILLWIRLMALIFEEIWR